MGVSVVASGYVCSCQWVCLKAFLQVPMDVFEDLSMGVFKCLVLSSSECLSDYRPVGLSKCVPVVHLEVWQWVGVTIGQ